MDRAKIAAIGLFAGLLVGMTVVVRGEEGDLELARAVQPILANQYSGMSLAYDGSTLFGLNHDTLYTLNPETGVYTQVAEVTGISQGNMMLQCMSAIPVIAS